MRRGSFGCRARALAVAPIFVALAFMTAPARALEIPQPGPKDVRVRTVDYDPAQVVRLTAQPRIAIQLVFAGDEVIRHVALGDSSAWQVAADGNVLFLKPRGRRAATNLIVTTERAGAARSYVFEMIVAAPGGRRAQRESAYAIRFRYPADAVAKARAAVESAATAAVQQISRVQVEAAALEGSRNLAYQLQGPATLQPAEVSDNGRFTVLRFPGGQVLPVIYTVGVDGTETLATFDVRGEFMVIHGVAPGLRLRLGRQLLCITNDAYRPQGSPSLTASPDVIRTERGSAQ